MTEKAKRIPETPEEIQLCADEGLAAFLHLAKLYSKGGTEPLTGEIVKFDDDLVRWTLAAAVVAVVREAKADAALINSANPTLN
jgi:hypothetical protein